MWKLAASTFSLVPVVAHIKVACARGRSFHTLETPLRLPPCPCPLVLPGFSDVLGPEEMSNATGLRKTDRGNLFLLRINPSWQKYEAIAMVFSNFFFWKDRSVFTILSIS